MTPFDDAWMRAHGQPTTMQVAHLHHPAPDPRLDPTLKPMCTCDDPGRRSATGADRWRDESVRGVSDVVAAGRGGRGQGSDHIEATTTREEGGMSETKRTCCGRCGVYRDLHPTSTCEKSRHSFWWDEHYLWRHVAAWLWLRLNDRRRMDLVHRYWSRNKHLCWCEFVDSALLDDKRDDYEDDLCDVPLPFGVGPPRIGWCYCSPVTAKESA